MSISNAGQIEQVFAATVDKKFVVKNGLDFQKVTGTELGILLQSRALLVIQLFAEIGAAPESEATCTIGCVVDPGFVEPTDIIPFRAGPGTFPFSFTWTSLAQAGEVHIEISALAHTDGGDVNIGNRNLVVFVAAA